jgi:hypothetical protein
MTEEYCSVYCKSEIYNCQQKLTILLIIRESLYFGKNFLDFLDVVAILPILIELYLIVKGKKRNIRTHLKMMSEKRTLYLYVK